MAQLGLLLFNEQAMHHLLDAPDGPVGRDLARRCEQVVTAATYYANGAEAAGANNPEGRGPKIRTGALSTSIRFAILSDGQQLVGQIGSDVFYSTFLETGLKNGRTYPFLRPALPAAALD